MLFARRLKRVAMNGIIIIDKPQNFTSFDVVAIMRKLFSQKKIGHAGTLDPMATGVLPILLGSATKVQDMFPDSNKEYIAGFKLGVTTDTLDITGKILSRSNSSVKRSQVEEKMNCFKGNIKQMPPMYSALKKDGKKLYELARKGIEVQREKRDVYIQEIELIDFDEKEQTGTIRVLCSKGTYIRSLCDDLGSELGCGAVMTKLRRTMACGFRIEESMSIDKAKDFAKMDKLKDKIISIDKIFSLYPSIKVSDAQARRFKNGGSLDLMRTSIRNNYRDKEKFRVYNQEKFLGLGITSREKEQLLIYKLF